MLLLSPWLTIIRSLSSVDVWDHGTYSFQNDLQSFCFLLSLECLNLWESLVDPNFSQPTGLHRDLDILDREVTYSYSLHSETYKRV